MNAGASPFRCGTARHGNHTTSYLECGPANGIPLVLVHGWPETSWAWRHQLAGLGALGYRVIAPDLRGTGGSTLYRSHDEYALRHHVADMIALVDGLDVNRAVWIGHDWGAPIVWTTARHHAHRFLAAGSLSTPYDTLERGYERMVSFVNRTVYPEDEFPAGQLDYFLYYRENFAQAQRQFEADIPAFFATVLRAGETGREKEPTLTATVRRNGGWFGSGAALRLPIDRRVIDDVDLAHLVESYQASGFFGINSLYMNDQDNREFVAAATTAKIQFPTLFIAGRSDYVNDTEYSHLADAMRTGCAALDYHVLDAGHWIHHERHHEVTAIIDQWLKGPAGIA